MPTGAVKISGSSILIIATIMGVAQVCTAWSLRQYRISFQGHCRTIGTTRLPTSRLCGVSWDGAMAEFSEYAMHVRVGEEDAPVLVQDAIRRSMGNKVDSGDLEGIPTKTQKLTSQQLLQLGSIWYLSKADYDHNQQAIPNSIVKPSRLTLENSTTPLEFGDYMRIHHTPRRFPRVYQSCWIEPTSSTASHSPKKPAHNTNSSVIVKSGPGFWIIDKPPLIPVHATVDNAVENIVHQLHAANEENYVTTPQRLDINTSGLLVVATKLEFAAYFAQLLRHKTKQKEGNKNITKGYTCLVCLKSGDKDDSIYDEWKRLVGMQDSIIQHYLEQSDRVPKRFEPEVPIAPTPTGSDDPPSKWLECRLQITNVSQLYPIPSDGHPLATGLWTSALIPEGTKAICEVEIQLHTGRTHQIRGQLARLGFAIVGDEQYGGATPVMESDHGDSSNDADPQLLALQCSKVGFWDADYSEQWHRKRKRYVAQGSPSDRWVEATLDRSWWTSVLEEHVVDESVTSSLDMELLQKQEAKYKDLEQSSDKDTSGKERHDLLPPSVQLSPGRNKYVLVKVRTNNENQWFVKSASPGECGGPYHANVAEDLVEWIRSAGFTRIQVAGGGRIDYSADSNRAHVYGFSYGFGKGDHAKVAKLIGEAGMIATFDESNNLY